MDNQQSQSFVLPEEDVARIINNAWVDDGVLLYSAFAFAIKETYLSVNRLAVDTYEEDVRTFVMSHPAFQIEGQPMNYRRALMNVGDINNISLSVDSDEIAVSVEVEPRDTHTKSHAGIFARIGGQNLVLGRPFPTDQLPEGVSVDRVLQEVQWQLKDVAELQVCKMAEV